MVTKKGVGKKAVLQIAEVCYHGGMTIRGLLCRSVLSMLLLGGVALGDADLSSPVAVGHYDTAVWTNNGTGAVFQNVQENEAVYEVPIEYQTFGRILTIRVEVETSPSNMVVVALGNASGDVLTLECQEGVWEMMCGAQLHDFETPIPPLQWGTRTHTLRFVASPWGGAYSPKVTTSDNGVISSANHLAPAQSQWEAMGDPLLWTRARFHLRGTGGVKGIDIKWSEPPLLIRIR